MLHSFFYDVFPLLINIIVYFSLIALSLFVSLLLHELGHAIPMIFMSRGKIEIYVGLYGDQKKSLIFSLGRLIFFCKYNPFLWIRGLCVPPIEKFSVNKKILYTFTGPLMSFLLTVSCWYLISLYNFNGIIKFMLGAIFYSSFIFAISTIFPQNFSRASYKGRRLSSDGQQILNLLKYKRLPQEYIKASEYFNNGCFEEAAEVLDDLMNKGHKEINTYRLALLTNLSAKKYEKSIKINELIFKKKYLLKADDYYNDGFLKFKLGNNEYAIKSFFKALEFDPEHVYSLNNLGYFLGLSGKYQESLEHLNKAILINPQFSYSYNNRGFTKIKLGDLEAGLQDINHAIELDDKNSYNFRNLGVYHLEKNELDKALLLFEKAKGLDPDTHLIDQYINDVKQRI